MSESTFFLAGITGRVGGAAAAQLLKDGHKVRALVRDPAKAANWSRQGVEIRQGDWNDAAVIAGALEGVAGAYLMMPPILTPKPGFPEAKAVIASFREALRQTPPPRLVLLSSIGSEQTSGLGLITSTHLMEDALDNQPFPVAIVRAGGFFENYAGALESSAASGVFYSLYQPVDRTAPMIATADIGKEVARLLTTTWTGKRIIELGSPTSPNDLAHAMSEAAGKPVKAQAVPRDRWAAALEAFMPPGTTGPYEEMVDGFNSGWIHFGVPGTEAVAGTVTASQFFAQLKKA